MKTRSSSAQAEQIGPQLNLDESFASVDSEIEMVDFDVEDGTDDPGAQAKMGSIKTNFDPKDPEFFFLDLEAAMSFIGIKAQYTKRFCLMSLLPAEVKREIKTVIKASTTGNGYKKLKDALMQAHGPKPGQDVEKAANLLLVGKPSALANEIISLICKHDTPLEACCCENVVLYFWTKQLPNAVKTRIAGRSIKGQNNLQEVLDMADAVFASTQKPAGQIAAIAQANATQKQQGTSNQASGQSPDPEVSAVTRGGRGRGNNARGGRGRGRGQGGQARGNGQQQYGQMRQNGTSQAWQSWGPRHSDNLPNTCCRSHWRFGGQAYFCSDRQACPWRDRLTPRPGPPNPTF